MDKSSGTGLNQPFVRHDPDDKDDPTPSFKDTKRGKFKNKQVEIQNGSNTIKGTNSQQASHLNQNKKKIDQDYNISLEQSRHNTSIKDDQQTTPTTEIDVGKLFFVDSLSKQKVIDQFRNNQPPLSTICIRSSEDLVKHDLLQDTWLEDGELKSSKGRLFREPPLTLIFDLTSMSPSDIASINDMLQENPSCNGNPLGSQVKRVCLVNNEMLTGDQASNPDLWRRLGRMTKEEISDDLKATDVITDDDLLTKITTEKIPTNKKVVSIDFTLSDSWHQLLFGGISFDNTGKIIFIDGALSKLGNNVHLVFKNAPWDNLDFKETMASTWRNGCFEANHKLIQFSKNITISKKEISPTELYAQKKNTIKDNSAFNPNRHFVCLNSLSLENLKGKTCVNGSKVVQTNMIATLLQGSKQLVITDDLNNKQWLWLLTQLEQLPKQMKVSLFTGVPPVLLISSNRPHWRIENDVESCTKNLDAEQYFKYDINPGDSLESLCQVNLTSQQQFNFSLNNSPLLENLIRGKLVVFSGLEKNPKLSASLETLLLPEPYLYIYGNKMDIPAANIALIPSKEKSYVDSTLIDEALPQSPEEANSFENPIYLLLKDLPGSFDKKYPDVPPWHGDMFQKQFKEQADIERKFDGSVKLLPTHKRRALHVLLAKAYRANSNVYGYIKAKIAQYYPDKPEDNYADKSALQQWLLKHPNPDLKMIRSDFWTLAQYCPVNVYKAAEDFNDVDTAMVEQVASYLVGSVSDKTERKALEHHLTRDLQMDKTHAYYDGTARSNLKDVLVANRTLLKDKVVISEAVEKLEIKLANVLKKTQPDRQKRLEVKQILCEVFKAGQLPQSYEDVPEVLLANKRHTLAQQERRLAHLTQRVLQHPIVFLQGEAGAGKSFMAQAIATKAGYKHGCQIIQLGPDQTAEDLFGGLKLISRTVDGVTDQYTKFVEGPLLKWALSSDPPLLVLDEANLAPNGLLAPLAGLMEKPPVLYFRGGKCELTKKHRVILTGNPDYYEERHLDDTLKSCVPTFFYHPLQDSALANSIIKPGLPEKWSDEMKQQASERLLTLFHHFQKLVPDDLTTPRDLKDVLATIRQILRHNLSRNMPTEKQINALISRAFMDSLGGAVKAEQQQGLSTLNSWYQQQFPEDNTISQGVDTAFIKFLNQLKEKKTDANFKPLPIQQLVYRYWQSLDKDNTGRTASIVEGPAGWGKDFILKKVIEQWQDNQSINNHAITPFVHINANANQWSILVNEVKKAMENGQIIAISELNLIPSNYLEGLFNDVLTGRAKSGFRLFSTINPGSFEGRESLSPALKSRCTQIRLGTLSQQDLKTLIENLPSIPKDLSQWLGSRFYQLSNALENELSPIQLSLDDLFKVARHLSNKNPKTWSDEFQNILWLPLKSLNKPFSTVLKNEKYLLDLENKEKRRINLESAVNSINGLKMPMILQFGNNVGCRNGVLTISANQTKEEVLDECRLLLREYIDNEDTTQSEQGSKVNFHNNSVQEQKTIATSSHKGFVTSLNSSPYRFGDIEQEQTMSVTRYFPEKPYHNSYYRLNFIETRLDKAGELRDFPISWLDKTGKVIPITGGWTEKMPWKTALENDEVSGHIELTIHDDWQPLPALTSLDDLRAIRLSPEVKFALARSKQTGQLLIKAKTYAPMPVTIDFIVAPDQDYFFPLEEKDSVKRISGLCTKSLRKVLDQEIFKSDNNFYDSYKELRSINEIDNISLRLNVLMYWLDTFSDTKNVTGQGEKLFLNIIREKQGVCRHKAMIFQMLCHYWDIPARQVFNASHAFVEVSPDGGKIWRQYQLGGGGDMIEDVSEPSWDEYTRHKESILTPQTIDDYDSESQDDEEYSYNGDIPKSCLDYSFSQVSDLIDGKATVPSEMLDTLKENLKTMLKSGDKIKYFHNTLYNTYFQLLSPEFYEYIHHDNEWLEIISKLVELSLAENEEGGYIHRVWHVGEEIKGNNRSKCLSPSLYNDYIDWVLDLCDTNDIFKKRIFPYLQKYVQKTSNLVHKNRIKNMTLNYFDTLEFRGCEDGLRFLEIEQNKRIKDLIRTLPKSRFLESKISQNRIVKTYASVPKENSQLIPENLACGLPAFLNQSTIKKDKPVVIDLRYYGRDMQQLIESAYYDSDIKGEFSKIYKMMKKEIKSKYRFADHVILPLFFTWISNHKSDAVTVWRWLSDTNQVCHEQKKPGMIPVNAMYDNPSTHLLLPMDIPSEEIKKQMKEPSAVVLKEKELLILFREFDQMLRS